MMDIEEVLKNTCQPATEWKSCLLPSYCYLFCCLNLWVKKLLPLSPAALHLDLLIFKRNFAHNLRLMQPAHYPKLTSPEEMKKSIQKWWLNCRWGTLQPYPWKENDYRKLIKDKEFPNPPQTLADIQMLESIITSWPPTSIPYFSNIK